MYKKKKKKKKCQCLSYRLKRWYQIALRHCLATGKRQRRRHSCRCRRLSTHQEPTPRRCRYFRPLLQPPSVGGGKPLPLQPPDWNTSGWRNSMDRQPSRPQPPQPLRNSDDGAWNYRPPLRCIDCRKLPLPPLLWPTRNLPLRPLTVPIEPDGPVGCCGGDDDWPIQILVPTVDHHHSQRLDCRDDCDDAADADGPDGRTWRPPGVGERDGDDDGDEQPRSWRDCKRAVDCYHRQRDRSDDAKTNGHHQPTSRWCCWDPRAPEWRTAIVAATKKPKRPKRRWMRPTSRPAILERTCECYDRDAEVSSSFDNFCVRICSLTKIIDVYKKKTSRKKSTQKQNHWKTTGISDSLFIRMNNERVIVEHEWRRTPVDDATDARCRLTPTHSLLDVVNAKWVGCWKTRAHVFHFYFTNAILAGKKISEIPTSLPSFQRLSRYNTALHSSNALQLVVVVVGRKAIL